MSDYYQILGIPPDATPPLIRAAYKRLAMAYHPDHNPGDRQAEEVFKLINEAYHTLSDPLKKSRYDARMNYNLVQELDDIREANKRKYYRWKRAQEKTYVINREYFKIQGLAFLVFTVIAGFCFGLLHTANYMVEQKQLKHYQAATNALLQVDTLFTAGRFADAFGMIKDLAEKDPLEYRYNYARDSLLHTLRHLADERYIAKDFSSAATHYLELQKHENPVRSETIRQIAVCEYYIGNYKESVQALKHLHNQSPRNLQLIFEIGLMYLEKIENPREALHYLSMGTNLFNKNLTEVYGSTFRVVMDPADAPDIYFDIFQAHALANMQVGNYGEAADDCDWAIFLRPSQGLPYKIRAEANASRQHFEMVCTDLARARQLAAIDTKALQRKYCR